VSRARARRVHGFSNANDFAIVFGVGSLSSECKGRRYGDDHWEDKSIVFHKTSIRCPWYYPISEIWVNCIWEWFSNTSVAAIWICKSRSSSFDLASQLFDYICLS
jgi:hypothetical protein